MADAGIEDQLVEQPAIGLFATPERPAMQCPSSGVGLVRFVFAIGGDSTAR
jgi:hypothetical protein